MELSCVECFSSAEDSCSQTIEVYSTEETILEHNNLNGQSNAPIALDDQFMNWDPRVLQNLFSLETTSMPSCDYFEHVQDDIQPFMRKVVTSWMLEVCEEQSCEEQVFPLAVCLLDRFLCEAAVPRARLQLLACATLLISSKLRQTTPLSVPLLAAYTDNSITHTELINSELMVLQVLQWRTSLVTSFDFVEILLARTSSGPARTLLRRHAHTLSALCYTEMDFMRIKPSMIATACIASAARGLSTGRHSHLVSDVEEMLMEICNLTSSCPVTIAKMVHHIELLIAKETTPVTPQKSISSAEPTSQPTTPQQVEDVIF